MDTDDNVDGTFDLLDAEDVMLDFDDEHRCVPFADEDVGPAGFLADDEMEECEMDDKESREERRCVYLCSNASKCTPDKF